MSRRNTKKSNQQKLIKAVESNKAKKLQSDEAKELTLSRVTIKRMEKDGQLMSNTISDLNKEIRRLNKLNLDLEKTVSFYKMSFEASVATANMMAMSGPTLPPRPSLKEPSSLSISQSYRRVDNIIQSVVPLNNGHLTESQINLIKKKSNIIEHEFVMGFGAIHYS
uniref:HTH psq-type domain-containing protein n=1 Tax=Rhabditophanes sp. KR3021 TaxID=114890 RepID=A0AC35TNV8_9BILA